MLSVLFMEALMEQSSLDTIQFCLEFVKNNYSSQSQNVQCRKWLKMVMQLLEKGEHPNKDFIIMNLLEVDGYFSGANSKATSNTIFDKIEFCLLI